LHAEQQTEQDTEGEVEALGVASGHRGTKLWQVERQEERMQNHEVYRTGRGNTMQKTVGKSET
jgi:protein tyrosine phosphatase (PTP) superfamily phosphohydrolase (DUF442 family)